MKHKEITKRWGAMVVFTIGIFMINKYYISIVSAYLDKKNINDVAYLIAFTVIYFILLFIWMIIVDVVFKTNFFKILKNKS